MTGAAEPPWLTGYNVGTPNSAGNRPVHAAALSGSVPTLQLLIGAGCDVNARGTKRNTPLHLAASRADLAVVRALLAAGADPELRNESGFTPLGVIVEMQSLASPADTDLAEAPSHVCGVVRALRDARSPRTIAVVDERGGPHAADARRVAASAISRGGDLAHLPPPPSAIDLAADDVMLRALRQTDASPMPASGPTELPREQTVEDVRTGAMAPTAAAAAAAAPGPAAAVSVARATRRYDERGLRVRESSTASASATGAAALPSTALQSSGSGSSGAEQRSSSGPRVQPEHRQVPVPVLEGSSDDSTSAPREP